MAGFVPDLVLLNFGLLGAGGHKVACHFRDLPGLEQVKCVAVTGCGAKKDHEAAARLGF